MIRISPGIIFLLTVFLLCGIQLYGNSASSDTGTVQIQISRGSSDGIHFPLFREWIGRCRAASVRNAEGSPLAFKANFLSDRLCGLNLQASAKDYPLIILLKSKEDHSPSGKAGFRSGSVILTTGEIPLTTRAFTMPEMLRLASYPPFHRRKSSPMAVDMPGMLPEGSSGSSLLKVRSRHCRLLVWHAHFFLAEAAIFQTGVNAATSAWMTMVDGRTVNGWKEPPGLRSLPLKAGYHRLQYFVFLNSGEKIPIPELTFAHSSEDAFQNALIPWNLPKDISIDCSGHQKTDLRLSSRQDFFWRMTGKNFSVRTLTITENGPEKQQQFVQFSDHPGLVNFTCGERTLTLEMPAYWRPPTILTGRLRWEPAADAARAFFRDEPCRLTYRLTMQKKMLRRLDGALKIIVRETDRNGSTGAVHSLIPDSNASSSFSAILAPDTVSLILEAEFHGKKVLEGGVMHIIRPEDSLERLELRGKFCSLEGHQVLFCCRRPVRQQSGISLRSGTVRHVCLFPGSRGPLRLPTAGSTVFSQMELTVSPGSSPEQQEWLDLGQIAAMKPNACILNISRGLDFPSCFRKLCFMIQYLRHRGIQPVLVCPPVFSGENREAIRLQALYIKEFAWKYGLESLDIYSQLQRAGLCFNNSPEEDSEISYLEPNRRYLDFLTGCLLHFFNIPEN